MTCTNCKAEIPANSRFCMYCGATQPVPTSQTGATVAVNPTPNSSGVAADGGHDTEARDRQAIFNRFSQRVITEAIGDVSSDLDLEARQKYNIAGRSFGCLGAIFFLFMGIIMLIPAVPLLAFFGIPAAIILAPLTYANIAHLHDKLSSVNFLRKLPGFQQGTRLATSFAIFCYLTFGSVVSILILAIQSRP